MDKQKIVENRLATLPPELKKFFVEGSWIEKTKLAANKLGLSPDHSDHLEDEVLVIIIGLDIKKNFVSNLTENLSISSELANSVFREIDSEIFSHIDAYLPTEEEQEVLELKQPHDLIEPHRLPTSIVGFPEEKAMVPDSVQAVTALEQKLNPVPANSTEVKVWEQRKEGVADKITFTVETPANSTTAIWQPAHSRIDH